MNRPRNSRKSETIPEASSRAANARGSRTLGCDKRADFGGMRHPALQRAARRSLFSPGLSGRSANPRNEMLDVVADCPCGSRSGNSGPKKRLRHYREGHGGNRESGESMRAPSE